MPGFLEEFNANIGVTAAAAAATGLFRKDKFDHLFGEESALQKKIEALNGVASQLKDPKAQKSSLYLLKSLKGVLIFIQALRGLGIIGVYKLFSGNKRSTAEKYFQPILNHLLLSYMVAHENFEGEADKKIHQEIKEFSNKIVDIVCADTKKIEGLKKYFPPSDWMEWDYISKLDVSTDGGEEYRENILVDKMLSVELGAFKKKVSGCFHDSNRPKILDLENYNDIGLFFKTLLFSIIPQDNKNSSFVSGLGDIVKHLIDIVIPVDPKEMSPVQGCLKESIAQSGLVSDIFKAIKSPQIYTLIGDVKKIINSSGVIIQKDNKLFEGPIDQFETLSDKTQYFMSLDLKRFMLEHVVFQYDYKEFFKKFSWDTIVSLDPLYGNKLKKIEKHKQELLKQSLFEYIDAKLNEPCIGMMIPPNILHQISKESKDEILKMKFQTKASEKSYKEEVDLLNENQKQDNIEKIAGLNELYGFPSVAEYCKARSAILKKAVLKAKKEAFQKKAAEYLGLKLDTFEERSDHSFLDNLCASLFKKEESSRATIKQLREMDNFVKANALEVDLVRAQINNIAPQKKEIIDSLSKIVDFDYERVAKKDLSGNVLAVYDEYAKLYGSVERFFRDNFFLRLVEADLEDVVDGPESEVEVSDDDEASDEEPEVEISDSEEVELPPVFKSYIPVSVENINAICRLKSRFFIKKQETEKKGEVIFLGVFDKNPIPPLHDMLTIVKQGFFDIVFKNNDFSGKDKDDLEVLAQKNIVKILGRYQDNLSENPKMKILLKDFEKDAKDFCGYLNTACKEVYDSEAAIVQEKLKKERDEKIRVQAEERARLQGERLQKRKEEKEQKKFEKVERINKEREEKLRRAREEEERLQKEQEEQERQDREKVEKEEALDREKEEREKQAAETSKAFVKFYTHKIELYTALKSSIIPAKNWFKRVWRKIKAFFSKAEAAKMMQEKLDNALISEVLDQIDRGVSENTESVVKFSPGFQVAFDKLKAKTMVSGNALGEAVKPSIDGFEQLRVKRVV